MIVLPAYKQSSAPWGSKVISSPPYSAMTMAQWGCMITSFAMAIKNYAIPDDPGVVCDKFLANGVLSPSGNFIQQNVSLAYPRVHHKARVYTSVEPSTLYQKTPIAVALDRIGRFLALGQPVLLNVDLVGHDKNSDHWVVAVNRTSTDLEIYDPAFGDHVMFSSRYGSPETGVYGYSAFIGQPIEFAPGGDPRAGAALVKLADANSGVNVTQNIREALDSLL